MNTSIRKPFAIALRRALVSGTTASVLSALTVAQRGSNENVGALRGMNSVSHWLWGDRALKQKQPSWRYTATGALIHHASSMLWATVFETSARSGTPLPPKKIIRNAAVVTALAWLVDFYLTPKRLTPGFERVLSKRSLLLTYAAFGGALSLCGIWAARREKASLRHQRSPQ